MSRPITLFTGQWADLTFDMVCAKAKAFGYDGVEIACWGDHFEVDKALESDKYIQGRWDILNKHGLSASRSARTWWARPCATALTSAMQASCPRASTATARRTACAPARPRR